MLGKEELLLPGLVNMTLGDGFAGCVAVISHILPCRNNGKTFVGSFTYLLTSVMGLHYLNYPPLYSFTVSMCGMVIEGVTHDNDNVYIVGVCFLVAILKEHLQK